MRRVTKLFLAICVMLALSSCTDANMGKFTALGDNAEVKCYSGGTLIYSGISTGKVKSEQGSDGYFFKDSKTGKFKEVSGDCDITYDPEVEGAK